MGVYILTNRFLKLILYIDKVLCFMKIFFRLEGKEDVIFTFDT